MAYMNQVKKAIIAEQLKKAVPAGWKYSVAVRHHSTIVLTIKSAPVDLIAETNEVSAKNAEYRGRTVNMATTYFSPNEFYLEREFGASLEIMEAIKAALNTGNHDNSDPMTDYFDVGHYIDIQVGNWEKPFICTAAVQIAPADWPFAGF